MGLPKYLLYCAVTLWIVQTVRAAGLFCEDTDMVGNWNFYMGSGGHDKTLNCARFRATSTYKITLKLPNIAIDQNGVMGNWTMVESSGFEVTIAGKKYFGFRRWVHVQPECDKIDGGWSHTLKGEDWTCYNGRKRRSSLKFDIESKLNSDDKILEATDDEDPPRTETKHPKFERVRWNDFVRETGSKFGQGALPAKATPLTKDDIAAMEQLPKSFDWRNVKGVNYVSPVRKGEKTCSAYSAFASMGMLEARVRIASKNKRQPVFSVQDIVDCNEYGDFCAGIPYLAGGKYAEDFGVVTEECSPYKAKPHTTCGTSPQCSRHYATNYSYIGGYYGACNEARMMKAIYENGPITSGLYDQGDLYDYKGGIYHGPVPNEFQYVNKFVLIVGWGENNAGQKYWIVKNSWGKDWGLQGYFWITKGANNCYIEAHGVESFPIIPGRK